jgi:lipoate-protein ligase A
MEKRVCEAIKSAAIPVADKTKKTTFAIAMPKMTKKDLLNPLDADSAVTAIAAGPGESTTTNVVARKSISVSNGIIKSSYIYVNWCAPQKTDTEATRRQSGGGHVFFVAGTYLMALLCFVFIIC